MTWSDSASDPLADIRAMYRKLDDARREAVCDPADVDRVQAALRELGVGHLWTIRPSPLPGWGNLWVVNSGGNAAVERWRDETAL